MFPTPKPAAAISVLPESRTTGAPLPISSRFPPAILAPEPSSAIRTSISRQDSTPVCSSFPTASLAANRAAREGTGSDFRWQQAISAGVKTRSLRRGRRANAAARRPISTRSAPTRISSRLTAASLHGNSLGQIARLIHRLTPVPGQVICKQLQRDHGEERRQHLARTRNGQDHVSSAMDRLVAFRHHSYQPRPPGFHLLHVGDHLIVDAAVGRHHHYGRALFQQRDRAVFHLSSRVGLRRYVRYLF